MYEKRNKVYADPYKVLVDKAGTAVGTWAQGRIGDYTEADAPLSEIMIDSSLGVALWGGGSVACAVKPGADYGWYKTRLIKLRYSNDDQIAVMLNNDPTEVGRMQRWREWATDVAKAICSRLGVQC